MFVDLINPSVLVLYNYIIVPTLIDYVSYYEGYESKSARHQYNLMKQFVFLLIASVFIPMTGSDTVSAFFEKMGEEDLRDFSKHLSDNFLRKSDFFMRYLI